MSAKQKGLEKVIFLTKAMKEFLRTGKGLKDSQLKHMKDLFELANKNEKYAEILSEAILTPEQKWELKQLNRRLIDEHI